MEKKKVHFMGLGGAGVSAVAAFAKANDFEISGCDIDSSSPFLKKLLESKVLYFPTHDKSHLEGVDYLVISPAIESLDANNPELLAAKEKNIPTLIGEEFLAKYLLGNKKVIAISGTHGKSTTTAMVGKILEDASLDPSVMVGAIVKDWGTNFRLGQGEYFVIEADEYQKKFLLYHPFVTVVTAVEMDHPEFFKDLDEITAAFKDFVSNTQNGGRVVLGSSLPFEISNSQVLGRDFQIEKINLKLIGDFNLENAAIAAAVGRILGIDEAKIKTSLENFNGIGRRFEFVGEEGGVKIFDDYAHHPTAIKATVTAAKNYFPNEKIWLVYQPHMFSRTKYLFEEFVSVFKDLNIEGTILVDIYAARQENKENISSRDIVEKVNKKQVSYLADFEQVCDFLVSRVGYGNIVIVMGAGDIYKLSEKLLLKLKG